MRPAPRCRTPALAIGRHSTGTRSDQPRLRGVCGRSEYPGGLCRGSRRPLGSMLAANEVVPAEVPPGFPPALVMLP